MFFVEVQTRSYNLKVIFKMPFRIFRLSILWNRLLICSCVRLVLPLDVLSAVYMYVIIPGRE